MYTMDKYYVLDLETTLRGPTWNKGHPLWPGNEVVWLGSKTALSTPNIFGPMVDRDGEKVEILKGIGTKYPLVGHNIKFDLLYVLKNKWMTPKQLFENGVWDTQVVEYILSAQQHTYPTLDSCAVKYGGTVKDDKVAEMWSMGISTESIPKETIVPYLEADLLNTERTYLAQYQKVVEWGLLPLVESQMKALIAITIMEFNGMCVNKDYLEESCINLGKGIEGLEKELAEKVGAHIPMEYGDWKWSSTKDVSAYFFGGTYKVRTEVLVGKYKNGKDKYKVVYEERTTPAKLFSEPSAFGAVKNKLGYYTVDDDVLGNIGTVAAELILKLREMSKQKETYFENLLKLVFPSHLIHANINQASTKTGRLSCNKPNIQNQTRSGGIKEAYVSRFPKGAILEWDFKQLEVGGLAILSGDDQLIYDINHGVDIHTELYRSMHGRAPTPDERTPFKRLTFGLIYGAGAKTLAAQAGCTIEEAKKFIKTFYSRYGGVFEYHRVSIEEAIKGRKVTKERTKKGLPVGAYLSRSATGRMYVFKEYDNEWKGGTSFSPTELKNWRVQGFSTADIVPHMLGVVVECIYTNDYEGVLLPIMTVHDSLEFDGNVKDGQFAAAVKHVNSVLNNTSREFSKHFSIDMPVSLGVECSIGSTWGTVSGVSI